MADWMDEIKDAIADHALGNREEIMQIRRKDERRGHLVHMTLTYAKGLDVELSVAQVTEIVDNAMTQAALR